MDNEFFNDIIKELRRRIKELETDIDSLFKGEIIDDIDNEAIEPLSSIHETPDMIIVTIDMPLVKSDTVETKLIDENRLLVRGEIMKHISSHKIDSTYPYLTFKRYKKVITLPCRVKSIKKLSVRQDMITVYLSKY